jgi:hypothetical protein
MSLFPCEMIGERPRHVRVELQDRGPFIYLSLFCLAFRFDGRIRHALVGGHGTPGQLVQLAA